MIRMQVRDRETIQEAVRRFRKLVERSGLKKEMRRRQYYEKPSESSAATKSALNDAWLVNDDWLLVAAKIAIHHKTRHQRRQPAVVLFCADG